jgi:hypothetical protein
MLNDYIGNPQRVIVVVPDWRGDEPEKEKMSSSYYSVKAAAGCTGCLSPLKDLSNVEKKCNARTRDDYEQVSKCISWIEC